jgi:hypothetical protein
MKSPEFKCYYITWTFFNPVLYIFTFRLQFLSDSMSQITSLYYRSVGWLVRWLVGWLVYSCCSHLEPRASVKRFVLLQFLNVRHSVGLLGRVISPSQGRYLTHTDIQASTGIRTHDPNVQASEDSSCLRPRGHCDRRVIS